MRLWLSVAALLILTCVVLETSAGKSNRDKDTTKSNQKSVNPKEVRYSKNKSDYKKKGNGKEQEVVKEKKQRHNAEPKQKIDTNGVSNQNQNGRNEKMVREEQKRQKPKKQDKIVKNNENLRNEKNVEKESKRSGKKNKRSVEHEQINESLINDDTVSSSTNEETQLHSASKKVTENKFEKKSDGEAIANTEKLSENHPSEKSASSLDIEAGSLRKNKNGEEQQGKSKKTKKQKHDNKSRTSSEANVNSKKGKSPEKQTQTPDEKISELKENEDPNHLAENSYYLNEDGLIKEKKGGNAKVKKYKSSKKLSKTVSVCEHELNDEPSSVQESESCNLESDCSVDENRIHAERSKYFADDTVRSEVTEIEQSEADDKVDVKLEEEI